MQLQEDYQDRPQYTQLSITPGLQLKLSEVLSSKKKTYTGSLSSYRIQSDCTILIMREETNVDVYFCDLQMTRIQNVLMSIQGVNSLREISVKYNSRQEQVIMVYRSQRNLFFYKGRLPSGDKSQIRSSIISSDTLVLQLDKKFKILQISDIYYIPNIGAHCIVTTSTGQMHLFQYCDQKKKISFRKVEEGGFQNKVGGILKSIFKSFEQPYQYKSCKTFLYHPFHNEELFAILLMQGKLKIKGYNLAAQQPYRVDNSCGEIMNLQINISQKIKGNNEIISSLFLPNTTAGHEYQISIVTVCANGSSIDLNEVFIDLRTKINQFSTIVDIFNTTKTDEKNDHEEEPKQQLQFNKNTDFIDIQFFNNKIYAIYHKDVGYNKNHFITMIDRKIIKSSVNINSNTLDFRKQLRLIKIQKQTTLHQVAYNQIDEEQNPRLLLIGQSACFQFMDGYDYYREDYNPPQKQNRNMPSLPTYQNKLTDSQFSKLKVEKLIGPKDFSQLFNLLHVQSNQFNNREYPPSNEQIFKQLFVLIMLKLFTYQQQHIQKQNIQLRKEIFNQILPKIYEKSTDGYRQFIKNLFVDNRIESLEQIFKVLFEKRHYTGIYQVCINVIPLFISDIQRIYKRQSDEIMEMNDTEVFVEVLKHIANNYLWIYEKMLIALSQQNYMQTESIQPSHKNLVNKKLSYEQSNKDIANFSEVEQEQLMDKYLLVLNVLKTANNQNKQNIKSMRDIFEIYFNKGLKFRKLLISMAIKHKNICLFDFMLLKKMINKNDIMNFELSYSSIQNEKQIEMLFINLMNVTIKTLSQMQQNKGGRMMDKNLCALFWVPQSLTKKIYEYLMNNYPKIGIIFGIMHKMRAQVAEDISKKIQIFQNFNNPDHLLEIFQPLDHIIKDQNIKINIDLARMYSKSKNQFISVNSLIKHQNTNSIQISSKCWEQFISRTKKYSNEEINQKLHQIQKRFNIK